MRPDLLRMSPCCPPGLVLMPPSREPIVGGPARGPGWGRPAVSALLGLRASGRF